MKLFDRNKILFVFKRIDSYKKLTVLSFKKDRKITVVVDAVDSYTLLEEGFSTEKMHFSDKKELVKSLKGLMSKEFPNSHKLYIASVKK